MLRKGDVIPDFSLEAVNRPGSLGPWDFKQRMNLVVVVLHDAACGQCRLRLESLAGDYGAIRAIDAEVLAVVDDAVEAVRALAVALGAPFPVLADHTGSVRSAFAVTGVGLYLVDRYNALFESWIAPDGGGLPGSDELRGWLDFLDIQCEECHPPESWSPDG